MKEKRALDIDTNSPGSKVELNCRPPRKVV